MASYDYDPDVWQGYPGSVDWLDGRGFDHWCVWIDIEPTEARRSIHSQRAGKHVKYPDADLQRVLELHAKRVPWKAAMEEVFGYYSETIRLAVMNYERLNKAND
jgi:hypothetical protein